MQKKFFPTHFASSDVKYVEKVKGFSTTRNVQNGSANDNLMRRFGGYRGSDPNAMDETGGFTSSTFSGSGNNTANSTVNNLPRQ